LPLTPVTTEKKTPNINNSAVATPKPAITRPTAPIATKAVGQKTTPSPTVESIPAQTVATTPVEETNIVSEPAPAVQKAPQNNKPNRKKTKHDLPSLSMIDDEDEEEENGQPTNIKLEADLLNNTWKAYIAQIDSPSVKAAFQKAEVQVKDEVTINIQVGSQMAKGMIQQEKELIPFIRKRIPISNLAMEITIDTSRASQLIKPKKILSIKEKYELMRAKNPMVHELRLRLDLKPDSQ